jgi:hypothetical protein
VMSCIEVRVSHNVIKTEVRHGTSKCHFSPLQEVLHKGVEGDECCERCDCLKRQ